LRPARAALFFWLNVPNPIKDTDYPLVMDFPTLSINELRALATAAFEMYASSEM